MAERTRGVSVGAEDSEADPKARAAGENVPDSPVPFEPFPVLGTTRLYDSHWVGLRRDLLRLDDGSTQEHHVVEVGDAVAVLPMTKDGLIVMIGQFRHPHGKTHWEVPAGRLEPAEAPAVGAARELLEEAGYQAQTLVPLPGFYPLNGLSDHWCHLYIARDCVRISDQRLDPAERIRVQTFNPAETEALLRAGRIEDGFTALALLYARLLEGE